MTATSKITVEVAATNASLRASLREASVRTFKCSPRGLQAALKWADDECAHREECLGNMSYPKAKITIGDKVFSRENILFPYSFMRTVDECAKALARL